MASPIRIKDISRTVTTAADNEYIAVDGPNGSGKMLTPDPRGTATTTAAAAVAGHNASPIAHLAIKRRSLAGNLVLTAADLPQQKIIPDVDRDVTLPAEGADQWLFEICHGGTAYVVTLKRAAGTVVAVLVPGAPVVVAWDGVDFGIC